MSTYGSSAGAAARERVQSRQRSCLEIAIAPAAVRIARQWTAEQLARTDPPPSSDAIDSAILMVSELVTNAILAVRRAVAASAGHPASPAVPAGLSVPVPGQPVLRIGDLSFGDLSSGMARPNAPSPSVPARVWMVLTRLDEMVRIEVHDSSCAPLPAASAHDDDQEGGRGLTVVATLAAAWGWRPDALGKVVWCELAS